MEGFIMTSICTTPIYKLKELNNLFIEMTSKNCNQRCKSCYIDFPVSKNIKDFIQIDRIKDALNDTKNMPLQCIYLTGAEPMTHPDFNSILRLSLKRCNVCICTNGSFLNEKKVRFLKKVEDEVINANGNQIFFKLSLTHFDERQNDDTKYRGNFRQTIFALKTLSRYGFSSILTVQNFYNLEETEIRINFERIFEEQKISDTDIKIIQSFQQNSSSDFDNISSKTDCMYGRVLSANGIYVCPFLSNDYRGRVGSDLKNFSDSYRAETDFCTSCSKNNNFVFSIG